ncbi:hypothetical protein J6590_081700 [Homalodisca vitripennis]|nr:hypothetical protein J6590_081700 [Homalodisca vitripennis]
MANTKIDKTAQALEEISIIYKNNFNLDNADIRIATERIKKLEIRRWKDGCQLSDVELGSSLASSRSQPVQGYIGTHVRTGREEPSRKQRGRLPRPDQVTSDGSYDTHTDEYEKECIET